ncbi:MULTISPECIES: hypothetical protein [Sphingobium]|uniref:Lipoprotein n=1 Tax=Sphingobium chungbukense TaxID=56193 RepID=A0A0M3AWD4_9SPHN|nr:MULTISPECIES: hypothetical protein [Sphingobium]KKW92884.1 hypothetical protein YP76_08290 [Sphingobium chungbukense]PJG46940.1 hypothetical protein CAF53_00855 [Sphingobium sp. LB126]
MSAGKKLFPTMMLVLAAGCSPASGDHAGAGPQEQVDAAAFSEVGPSGAVAPGSQSTHILPDIDPTVTGKRQVPAKMEETPPVAMADQPLVLPIKPSVVNIPPPAYVPDLPPSVGAADPRPFPDEVTRYMVDRDSCDHFRGEEAYDMERRAFLQENIAELCTGTDARLARLRERYAQDPAVMTALSGYENQIEGNASQ